MFNSIAEENEFGSIEGYSVSHTDENYKIFLDDNLEDKVFLKNLIDYINLKGFENLSVIKNINVEEEFRGQGIGQDLLSGAIDCADIVLLVSDKYEYQLKGFVLDKFYESSDFKKISETSAGSLMCYPSSVAIDIQKYMIGNLKKNVIKIK